MSIMGWKDWPYWFRGGITFLAIYALFAVPIYFYSAVTCDSGFCSYTSYALLFPLFFIYYSITLTFRNTPLFTLLYLIAPSLTYQWAFLRFLVLNICFIFFLGAASFWFQQKIDNKKLIMGIKIFLLLAAVFTFFYLTNKPNYSGVNLDYCKTHQMQLSSASYSQVDCFRIVATETKNATICNEIQDPDSWNFCYTSVSALAGDPTLCEHFNNSHDADHCYLSVVWVTKDSTYCERIVRSEFKDECYENVVESNGDLNLCTKIVTNFYRGDCYYWAAKIKRDSSICSKIEDNYTRGACLANF